MFFIKLFLISIFISYSNQAESNFRKWGKEEGQLNWKNAVDKCKSNNMHLPTKKELLSLYKSPERQKWEGNWYWTSDELDSQRAWAVVLNVGDTLHIPKQYHNHVRCISITQ